MIKKLVAVLGMILIAGSFAMYTLSKPVDTLSPETVSFEVPKGASTGSVAESLKDNELIRSSKFFLLLIKRAGSDSDIKAGRYDLSQDMSYGDIIETLVKGSSYVESIRVTIPEGFEIRQISDLLLSKGLAEESSFRKALDPTLYDFEFLEGVETKDLEGFLFPDTYDIPVGWDPQNIVNLFLSRFDEIFSETHSMRLSEMDMTLNELVTMASIIEREARYSQDRKIISGVFYNRLEAGMRLQSCATVQFALGERKATLSYKDTAIESPYNTYLHSGLPPAPIASPGKEALEAALYPADTPYMFFFAIPGDPEGRHVFSVTYDEHLAAQARYKD